MAQSKHYTSFTVADGLPSNHIYHCVEDNKGFLWVATDAGIARFDGKHFQVFTTENGVPDNEVLEVVKEKNGTIWINSFKQSPAYFDEEKNRFINAKEDSNLAKVTGTANMQLFSMKDGGVIYINEKGSYLFKNKKLFYYTYNMVVEAKADGTNIEFRTYMRDSALTLYLVSILKNGNVDSVKIGKQREANIFPAIDNDLYVFELAKRKIYLYRNIQTHPLKCVPDSITTNEPYYSFSFTPTSIVILSNNAKLYVYDKQTLQLTHTFTGDYLSNGFYDDSKGNLWICTIDKGLLVYRQKQLQQVDLPADFKGRAFLSIAKKPNGDLLAGNYYGEVTTLGKAKFSVNKIVNKIPSRVKKILVYGKDVYTVSDASDGIFLNFTKKLQHPETKTTVLGGKAGLICNDTLILIGTSYGFLRLNPVTKKVNRIIRYKRVTSLVKINDNEVYVGSTDGLHKYNFTDEKFTSFVNRHVLLSERIIGLCRTTDGLVWIATSNNGIVVVRDDSVLLHINGHDGIISNSGRSIISGKGNQVWFGTAQGISVIDYRLKDRVPVFSIRNISKNDGLSSNEINEMLYDKDTVYAATGDGISIIPVNTFFPQANISTELIRIAINQRDTFIANEYNLNYDQQNIRMNFAGIDLSGHFQKLQYSLDNNFNWTDLADNNLTLQLNSGEHVLQVRAMDVNGRISSKILILHFQVATPFWKTWWFWIIPALVLQLTILYIIQRQQKKKKQQKLAKELAVVQTASLEQQAFTSLMNPHFMFNALNSIQHYINVQDRQKANRYLSDFASLIRKNFEAAQQSFIPLEQELENIKIYLRLEQMRFVDRFQYNIRVDVRLDTDQWMIPTMMLQPLLENALLHGIMPSTIKGDLLIEIEEKDDDLCIMITDNGIGMTNSLAARANNDHKSHGTLLISKRINALNNIVKRPIRFTSVPAFNNEQNPGNRTTIFIPADLYQSWQRVQVPLK